MNEYLSSYGQGDERRGKLIKRTILAVLVVAILGTTAFLYFRTWSEERAVNAFLGKLKDKDYKAAYATWGCTDATPCKYYPFEKFMDDWGPSSTRANSGAATIADSEVCGDGVIVTVNVGTATPEALTVSQTTGQVGFAPWPQCPGRHWRFKAFFKRIFGGA